MYSVQDHSTPRHGALQAAAALQTLLGYRGPERRTAASLITRWLALACDEIGLGLLLVADDGHVLHVNHTARAQLDEHHPLQLLGRELRARQTRDVAMLFDALAAARRGLRKVLTLSRGGGRGEETVALVPLTAAGDAGEHVTLMMLSRREVGEALSVQWFARLHSLTPAEARVLELLCQGLEPREVAEAQGVFLSTVRTQVGAIRAKTGARTIRAAVAQVARLPPMVGALRQIGGAGALNGAADAACLHLVA